MADEETKQILRELLAVQKEQAELFRQMNQTYDRQAQTYDQSFAQYKERLDANTPATVIRALALLAMAAVLVYLVFFGLHKH